MGGLAATHDLLYNDANQHDAMFFHEETSFGNLYPARFEQKRLQGEVDPIYPIPATAASCKRFPGFRSDQKNEELPHHGVRDTLIPWGLFCLCQQTRIDALEKFTTCPYPDCDHPLDRFPGFYRRRRFKATELGKASVSLGLRVRTGIDRTTGSAHQSILYSREFLQPGMTFWGAATVPDEQADRFQAFIQKANESGLLRLGNNRTRGFGRVTLAVTTIEEQDIESLRQRIQSFDAKLRAQAKQYDIQHPHALYLPITLTADAIVYDRLLRQRTGLDGDALDDLGIKGAERIYCNSSVRQVMGWNTLWRTPKADDIAITMGSTFLFGFSRNLDDDALLQRLHTLERRGIGIRQREGFGRLLVASPFHCEEDA